MNAPQLCALWIIVPHLTFVCLASVWVVVLGLLKADTSLAVSKALFLLLALPSFFGAGPSPQPPPSPHSWAQWSLQLFVKGKKWLEGIAL